MVKSSIMAVFALAVGIGGMAFAADLSDVYVSKSGNDSWDGSSPTHTEGTVGPKLTLQGGVNAVAAGGYVHVEAGVYSAENEIGYERSVTYDNKTYKMPAVVQLNKGNMTIVSTNRELTVIEGKWDPDGHPINATSTYFEGLGPKSARGIDVAADNVKIIGFTIRKCATFGKGAGNTHYDCGAAIWCRAGSAYVYNCNIIDCRAGTGAAMSGNGAAVCATYSCRFAGNKSTSSGHLFYRTTYHRNDLFEGNGNGSGYIGTEVAQTEYYINCTYVNNNVACSQWQNGGNMTQYLYNCAFLSEVANTKNTITNNTTVDGKFNTSWLICSNCAQVATTGRIAVNPTGENCKVGINKYVYYSPACGDWTPVTGSDLIDAGMDITLTNYANSEPMKTWVTKDYLGNDRKVGNAVDIGCIESQGTTKTMENGTLIEPATTSDFISFNGHAGSLLWAYLPGKTQVRIARGWATGEDMFNVEFTESTDTAMTGTYVRWPDLGEDQGFWYTMPANGSATVTPLAYKSTKTVYAKADYEGEEDGSYEKPFRNLNSAISNATMRSVIKVMPGVYDKGTSSGTIATGSSGYDGVECRVALSKYVALRSTEGAEKTIVTGGYNLPIFRVVENSYRAQVQGMTLTGVCASNAAYSAFYQNVQTSSYYSYGRWSRLSDCIVSNNLALVAAGIFGSWAERCYFADNRTTMNNVNQAEGAGSRGSTSQYSILSACIIEASPWSHDCTLVTTPINTTFTGAIWDKSSKIIRAANNMSKIYNCALYDAYLDNVGNGGELYGTVRTYEGHKWCSSKDSTGGYLPQYPNSDDIFAGAELGDYRLTQGSAGLTKSAWSGKYHIYEVGSYDGEALSYAEAGSGKPYPGAMQSTSPSLLIKVDTTRGKECEPYGRIVPTTDTIEVTFADDTTHQYIGYSLNGEEHTTTEKTVTLTGLLSHSGATHLEAIYSHDLYVDPSKSDSNDGFTAATAKKTLIGVITNAVSGDVVHAAEGTYNEGEMTNNVKQVIGERVVVPSGVTLKASGRRDYTTILGRWADESTSLRYSTAHTSLRCVNLQAGARLEGFTLRHGVGTQDHTCEEGDGNNDKSTSGGCVFGPLPTSDDATGWVKNCVLTGGGGRYGGGSYGCVLEDCYFYDNAVSSIGSAAFNSKLINCVINNSSGSAVQQHYGIYNCTIKSTSYCGRNTELDGINNSPIVNSILMMQFNAKCQWGRNNLKNIHDSVIWMASGTADEQSAAFKNSFTNVTVTASCSNIITQRIDWCKLDANNYFALQADSPLIDAGDVSRVRNIEAVMDGDFFGGQRVYNGAIDIGANEYDWRENYRAALKYHKIASVDSATSNVVENTEAEPKTITLTNGEQIALNINGNAGFFAKFAITGSGKLKIYGTDGTTDLTDGGLSEGATDFEISGQEQVTLAYTGEGSATLEPFMSNVGLTIIVK